MIDTVFQKILLSVMRNTKKKNNNNNLKVSTKFLPEKCLTLMTKSYVGNNQSFENSYTRSEVTSHIALV